MTVMGEWRSVGTQARSLEETCERVSGVFGARLVRGIIEAIADASHTLWMACVMGDERMRRASAMALDEVVSRCVSLSSVRLIGPHPDALRQWLWDTRGVLRRLALAVMEGRPADIDHGLASVQARVMQWEKRRVS